MPGSIAQEHRWTAGSFVAAGFALFIFLYYLISSAVSFTLPTDGLFFSGDISSDAPSLVYVGSLLDQPTPFEAGDTLLSVNGLPIQQILEAQHAFLQLKPPDWPDGTRLTYKIVRDGEHLLIDVPIRRVGWWQFYMAAFFSGISQTSLIMAFTGIFFFLIGVFVFILRPANRAAHALLFLGVGFFPFTSNSTIPTAFYPDTPPSIPFDSWTFILIPSIIYLVLSFPYPKAILQRFPLLTTMLIYLPWPVAFNLAYLFHMNDRQGYLKIAFTIYPIEIAVLMLVTLAALIHTSITVRDPVGRSQHKWMVLGIGSFVFLGIGGWLVSTYLFPETMNEGNWLTTAIGWLLMPVTLAIAITRYRLFDIDIIIRRTLQYSLITSLLALVYFGGTVLLQSIFTRMTGGSSTPIITVITTLVIASLFHPVRKRVQNLIDRRFYQRKYDAEKVLSAFGSAVRNEVEINHLTKSIAGVVEEVMQPDKLILWVPKPAGKERFKPDL